LTPAILCSIPTAASRRRGPEKNDCDYKYPGEGQGRVRDILRDAFSRGYDAGISIEPHVAVVFHDASVEADDRLLYDSYVRYGRAMEKMIHELRLIGGNKPEKSPGIGA
jgi:hypothetical protein